MDGYLTNVRNNRDHGVFWGGGRFLTSSIFSQRGMMATNVCPTLKQVLLDC
jgi:hypothetical protein